MGIFRRRSKVEPLPVRQGHVPAWRPPALDAPGMPEKFENPHPFALLYVCTGNIHRSPLGEGLTWAHLSTEADLVVASAGINALQGEPMGTSSAYLLSQLGGDPDGHIARQFTSEIGARADLILVAEASQRAFVLSIAPEALRRVFTLREFARLASHLAPLSPAASPEQMRAHTAAIASLRGQVPPPEGPEDIADPVGQDLNYTRKIADQIAEHVDLVIQTFGAGRSG